MARRNHSPEENERRAKVRKLLQASNISSMDDIQNLFSVCGSVKMKAPSSGQPCSMACVAVRGGYFHRLYRQSNRIFCRHRGGIPKTEIQNCIIHQTRNSTRYVSYKDLKALVADLKAVYAAVERGHGLGGT